MKTHKLFGALALGFVLSTPATAQASAPTMKAIRYHEFGGPEVLKLEDVPKPQAKADEVLVRVHAASVNPVDWKLRSGAFKAMVKLPAAPGFDVAGVVEAAGAEAKRFKVGDEVFGYLPLQRGGAYAEYVAAPESSLALKPKKASFVEAAAVPVAALTAWQALFDTAGLSEGQTVLVHAGAGGVGHCAVQLAKQKGAKVIATASASNAEFLKSLGADQVIDYRTQQFEELVHDVDVVLESVGGDTLERSYGVLKKGGFLVSIVGPPDQAKLEQHGLRGAGILVQPKPDELAQLAAMIDAGKLKPHVSETFPLADAKLAHEHSETGHARGKIVLEVVPAKK